MRLRVILFIVIFTAIYAHGQNVQAQSVQSLETRINAIVNRAEFKHALFGIEIYSLTDNKILYALNADNHLPVTGEVNAALKVGDTVAEIGAAAYDSK